MELRFNLIIYEYLRKKQSILTTKQNCVPYNTGTADYHTGRKEPGRSVDSLNKDKEIEAFLEGRLDGSERLKYEIAGELGLLDKVLEDGWKSLSAKETGRIGGMMTRKKRQQK